MKSFFGKEGPKYTFPPKYDEDGITEGKRHPNSPNKVILPGPCYYDIKDSKTIPQFTIGEKIKKIKMRNIPGVGTYNLMKENDWRVPCYSFGKGLRKKIITK